MRKQQTRGPWLTVVRERSRDVAFVVASNNLTLSRTSDLGCVLNLEVIIQKEYFIHRWNACYLLPYASVETFASVSWFHACRVLEESRQSAWPNYIPYLIMKKCKGHEELEAVNRSSEATSID
jgi:hypothetical protein